MQGQGSAVKDWRALPGGYPSIFGKNAGAGQCSKKLRALPLGGYPAIFGKNAGARQCSKKIGERYRWGATPHLWEKCRGKAVQQKLASATAGGATPLSLGKMQGQGSAVKSWSALLGKCRGQCSKRIGERYRWGLPSIFGKNAGAGQCSKKLECAFVKNWRALPLGATLYLRENALGKMQGQGSAAKIGERCWGATPLSCRSKAVQ